MIIYSKPLLTPFAALVILDLTSVILIFETVVFFRKQQKAIFSHSQQVIVRFSDIETENVDPTAFQSVQRIGVRSALMC